MLASEVMTRRVIAAVSGAPILDAIKLMLDNHISGLPVVDDQDRLIGIVTEGDFLRREETGTDRRRPGWLDFLTGPGKPASDYVRSHGLRVGDVMTRDPWAIVEATPLEEAVRLMEQHNVKRLPVLRDGRLVGIVSRANILQALVERLEAESDVAMDDASIRGRVMAELKKRSWKSSGVSVAVRDGVVSLLGIITDERQRPAVRVAAESVAGVKAVRDHLAWVEPNSGTVISSPEDRDADTP